MKTNNLIIISALGLVALFSAGAWFYKKSAGDDALANLEKNRQLLVRDHSPVLGEASAPVEIVEFLDPECETCRVFYPAVKEIMQQFNGKVRLVVRYAPFHKNSMLAVRILEAARKQGLYWETLGKFFEMQPLWGDHHNPKPELLFTYLPEVGVNVDQVKVDMNDPDIVRRIETDIDDLRALQIRRTPSFFVNGKPLASFGLQQLIEAVQNELKQN